MKVLQLAHSSLVAGHFGIERTLSTVRRTMDWPGVAKDVKLLFDSCPVCQKAKPAIVAKRQLHPLPIMNQHFERTAMDIFWALKRTRSGNKSVPVAMDLATKWPEAFALKNATAESVSG